MVEYHRAEKYRPDQGFSVAVAGLINMKSPGAFKPPRLYKVRGGRCGQVRRSKLSRNQGLLMTRRSNPHIQIGQASCKDDTAHWRWHE